MTGGEDSRLWRVLGLGLKIGFLGSFGLLVSRLLVEVTPRTVIGALAVYFVADRLYARVRTQRWLGMPSDLD
jgi:hypothetical protein